MSYPILKPGQQSGEPAAIPPACCALAVMAKAPRPGKVKTRLSPPLTADQAAALNICFLQDTAESIAEVARATNSAGVVVYTPVGDESCFSGLLPEGFQLLAQRGEGFGERLLNAAEDLLGLGYASMCLIDSDSPTMPQSALRSAVEQLALPGDRVVIGAAEDGGYYLIGLKQAHARLFADIAWSTDRVFAQTCEQVREAGLEVVELEAWFDVDDAATLNRLRRELLLPGNQPSSGYNARHTRGFLAHLDHTQESAPDSAPVKHPAEPLVVANTPC